MGRMDPVSLSSRVGGAMVTNSDRDYRWAFLEGCTQCNYPPHSPVNENVVRSAGVTVLVHTVCGFVGFTRGKDV